MTSNIFGFALPLNLQYFSADAGNGGGDADPPIVDTPPVDDPIGTKTDGSGIEAPEKTFTQEDIDRIVSERLSRDRKTRDDAAETKRLEDEQAYKELYEQALLTIQTTQADALNVKKESLLREAGYSDEQVTLLGKLVDGSTDEELLASIQGIKTTFPSEGVKDYVDPGAGNGVKSNPTPVDAYDKGQSIFARIRGTEQ